MASSFLSFVEAYIAATASRVYKSRRRERMVPEFTGIQSRRNLKILEGIANGIARISGPQLRDHHIPANSKSFGPESFCPLHVVQSNGGKLAWGC